MSLDIILAGVGGQGILSIAFVLDSAALDGGFDFKQAEVHGMSQRGGAVQSHLRMSKEPIHSDLIPDGQVDLVLAVEPLESLRYAHSLSPEGTVIAAANPFVNIPNYPDLAGILAQIADLPQHVLIPAESLAKHAGSGRAQNMIMLGAGSYLYPFGDEPCLKYIEAMFGKKSQRLVEVNHKAYRYGQVASGFYRRGLAAGLTSTQLLAILGVINPDTLDEGTAPAWKAALQNFPAMLDGELPVHAVPGTMAFVIELIRNGELG
jgi:indolepyruvate ferredoxin oxidoreductase, beta subunit